jgi:DinB superfamily
MNTRDTIRKTLNFSMTVLNSYISDLTDAELLFRPGKDCNHLAWQLGHLISSQASLLEMVAPGAAAKLPDGFDKQHSKETAGENNIAKFCSKETYAKLFEAVNNSVFAALAKVSDSDFDQPGPEKMRSHFPTVGDLYVLIASHPMMHAGQFVPVRRALGKPILM